MGTTRNGAAPHGTQQGAGKETAQTRAEPLRLRPRSGRILIVDDQADLRRVWARALGRDGHTVVEAANGRDAIATATTQRFDLVISDIQMPDMDGMALLSAMRTIDPDLPVLLLTGAPELSTAMQAVELGALEYLAKPVDLSKLAASTARGIGLVTERRASRRASEELAEHRRSTDRMRAQREGSAQALGWTGSLLGGRYRIGELIGEGGMGAVYEAVREDLADMRVAVKILRATYNDREDVLARFRREAETVAKLDHPNVVRLLDFQTPSDEPAFLVMERLRGAPLSELFMSQGCFGVERATFVVSQVLAALEAAHELDIVHRDLKPDNVFLTAISGVSDIVKLLDFGIAKLGAEANDSRLTQTGAVMGTPAYMAPEQARGETVDRRADIYAAGSLLYEALAGCPPYHADNYHALLFAIQQQEPPPLESLRSDLDPELYTVVKRAMARDPRRRYQTAQAMAEALAQCVRPSARGALSQTSFAPVEVTRAAKTDSEQLVTPSHSGPVQRRSTQNHTVPSSPAARKTRGPKPR